MRSQEPHLTSIFPPGGQRGTVAKIKLAGKNLGKITQLIFSRDGIKPKSVKGNEVDVAIGADVPEDDYEVWAVTDKGLTNPRRFTVGRHREINEAKANEDLKSAQKVELPVIINAMLNPGTDRDYYRFKLKADQTVHCVFRSTSLDGTARAALTLIGPDGAELLHDDGRAVEPALSFTVAQSGDYVFKVEERGFQTGANNVYRLALFAGSRLVSVFPHVLQRGMQQKVTLQGFDLPQGKPISAPLKAESGKHAYIRQSPILSITTQISVPKIGATDGGGWLGARSASVAGFRYTHPKIPGPLRFGLTNAPVTVETAKPHDTPKEAQTVGVPCTIAGRFLRPREVDWYRFSAKKGQSLWIETFAERDGHKLDLELAIHDANGKVIKTASDFAVKKSPVPVDTLDAMCAWKAPADGDYFVVVRDLYGASRLNTARNYRLSIGKRLEKVFFAAVPIGKNPTGLSIPAGGKGKLQVVAQRYNGHQDPIKVRVVNLPKGLKAKELVIPAKSNAAIWEFVADQDAPTWSGPLQLVAETKLEGKTVMRPVVPLTAVHTGSTVVRRCQDTMIAITKKSAPTPAKKKK